MATAADAGPSSLASAPNYAGPWSKLTPALHPTLEEHVVHSLGFTQMTPVQASVVPLFLSHKDVIVEAVTGSGKTLAYALPALQMIMKRADRLKKSQIGALIVCPTRELAIQVHGIVHDIVRVQSDTEQKNDDATSTISDVMLAVGGSTSSPADDYKHFREHGSDIVIGTPGRVEELLKRSNVDLKELEVLILDEADRLLDMGFYQTITSILHMLPKQRRTGLFSATMTDALSELVRVGLRNPVRVVVKVETKQNGATRNAAVMTTTDKRTPATLENYFSVIRPEHKLVQLLRILQREAERPTDEQPMRKSIVYFATCAQVNYFFKALANVPQLNGFKLYSLHGKQTPARRRATFDAFVSATPIGKSAAAAVDAQQEGCSVLLCTDVAARGLDLPNVDVVVQFDPPTDPKVFSHRCGRTARAGRRGRAVVLLHAGREAEYVEFLKVRKSPVRAYGYVTDGMKCVIDEPNELDKGAQDVHDTIRGVIRTDRALYELGMQAFVSFFQCYRKHEVSFVFRERDLALDAVAFSFGLLRLPRMPEVERWRKTKAAAATTTTTTTKDHACFSFHEEDVDMRTFAYADKAREQQRLAGVEARKQGTIKPDERKRKANVEEAWSDQKARKERKQVRREKKQRKRAFLHKQANEEDSIVKKQPSKSGESRDEEGGDGDGDDDDGMDDWAAEELLAKKERKGNNHIGGALQDDLQFDDL